MCRNLALKHWKALMKKTVAIYVLICWGGWSSILPRGKSASLLFCPLPTPITSNIEEWENGKIQDQGNALAKIFSSLMSFIKSFYGSSTFPTFMKSKLFKLESQNNPTSYSCCLCMCISCHVLRTFYVIFHYFISSISFVILSILSIVLYFYHHSLYPAPPQIFIFYKSLRLPNLTGGSGEDIRLTTPVKSEKSLVFQ